MAHDVNCLRFRIFQGNVGINTDNADEALTVHGNIHVTGRVVAPSDVRVKKDLREVVYFFPVCQRPGSLPLSISKLDL